MKRCWTRYTEKKALGVEKNHPELSRCYNLKNYTFVNDSHWFIPTIDLFPLFFYDVGWHTHVENWAPNSFVFIVSRKRIRLGRFEVLCDFIGFDVF